MEGLEGGHWGVGVGVVKRGDEKRRGEGTGIGIATVVGIVAGIVEIGVEIGTETVDGIGKEIVVGIGTGTGIVGGEGIGRIRGIEVTERGPEGPDQAVTTVMEAVETVVERAVERAGIRDDDSVGVHGDVEGRISIVFVMLID